MPRLPTLRPRAPPAAQVLYDVLKRADTGINIGYAVVYECVRTVTRIYPNVQLMETAANHISRFVAAENHNLKYLGIKALASIVQVNQKYALEHQMVVVECMEVGRSLLALFSAALCRRSLRQRSAAALCRLRPRCAARSSAQPPRATATSV